MSNRTKALVLLILAICLSSLVLNGSRLASVATKTAYESSSSINNSITKWIPETRAIINITSFNEPFTNRWQRRFSNSQSNNKPGGYLFFKHIRKAGGSALRDYFQNVFEYHNNSRTCDKLYQEDLDDAQFEIFIAHLKDAKRRINLAMKKRQERKSSTISNTTITMDESYYKVHYVEQEFVTMDWKCPSVDPRWKDSLSVISLRHPVERIMSEFFYAGPGKEFGTKINKTDLHTNRDSDYARELSNFIDTHVPLWMTKSSNDGKSGPNQQKTKHDFHWFFEPGHYMDNFQLRALAGCASGECLEKLDLTNAQRVEIRQGFDSTVRSNIGPNPACAFYFPTAGFTCHANVIKRICPNSYVGPCFYPAAAWGELGQDDLVRGIAALESFDVVLLMEKLGQFDQSAFLASVMGVPRDANFSIGRKNSMVEKTNEREITHFYRDILSNLTLTKDVSRMLHDENRLEIYLFEHATKLNTMMIDEWKRETDW